MKKKLIEVALPLEAINIASAREKSIRDGQPSVHPCAGSTTVYPSPSARIAARVGES